MNIGQKIKALRIAQGLKVEKIAKCLGICKVTYYRWESGEIKSMSVDHFLDVCRILNADPGEILTGIKHKTQNDWRMGQ